VGGGEGDVLGEVLEDARILHREGEGDGAGAGRTRREAGENSVLEVLRTPGSSKSKVFARKGRGNGGSKKDEASKGKIGGGQWGIPVLRRSRVRGETRRTASGRSSETEKTKVKNGD